MNRQPTELQRAQDHLRAEQQQLARARREGVLAWARVCERHVLAALSWLFDAHLRTARQTLWPCRDGRKIAIGDMATSHIQNCLNLMERSGGVWRPEYKDFLETELRTRKP